MSRRHSSGAAVVALGLLCLAPVSFGRSQAVPAGQHVPGTTTLDDQTELAVTVYNSDIALIRDVRAIEIARGTSDLHFMDIAATVNPATVHFRSLTEPSRVTVLEQNYEYDLLEPDKSCVVGRDVTLIGAPATRAEARAPFNNARWR
jgi:hypothetical protein